jgi:uncharacterized peroxidase-related enzyme
MSRFPGLPENTNLSDVFQAFPGGAAPLMDFHDIVLRKPSPLTVAQRELIAALVSGLNDCAFCFGAHSIIAESFGVNPELFTQLLEDIDSAEVDEAFKPILAYVEKLTLTPGRMSDQDAQRVFDAGWSEQALHDAVTVCALFNFMNRIVEGHGVVSNDSIRSGQRERAVKNTSQAESPTTYRDYGRMIGIYPGEPGEDNEIT